MIQKNQSMFSCQFKGSTLSENKGGLRTPGKSGPHWIYDRNLNLLLWSISHPLLGGKSSVFGWAGAPWTIFKSLLFHLSSCLNLGIPNDVRCVSCTAHTDGDGNLETISPLFIKPVGFKVPKWGPGLEASPSLMHCEKTTSKTHTAWSFAQKRLSTLVANCHQEHTRLVFLDAKCILLEIFSN